MAKLGSCESIEGGDAIEVGVLRQFQSKLNDSLRYPSNECCMIFQSEAKATGMCDSHRYTSKSCQNQNIHQRRALINLETLSS